MSPRGPLVSAETELFRDFAVIMLAAGVVALLFYYLKQPVILGYLLAGFIVGPYSFGPSFVTDTVVMSFLGELGIVFLLFCLGLEFSLKKLRKVGPTAIIAGTIEIAIMLSLGYWLGISFGWTPMQAIFLGAIMSISSTTVIVKVLGEMGKKDEEWAQTAFGILIIEDVLAVLILTALSSAGATGNFQPQLLTGLLYKLAIFLGAALLMGILFGPRIVDRLAALKVDEVVVILATGIGFGMALLAHYLGFSAGLGAFVAGALMAESPKVAKITHRIEPARDIFTAIFFVTVGAALDPASVVANWRPILIVTAAVVLGKIVGVTLATFVTGKAPNHSLRVGMTMAQIGEFAFIIAVLGTTLGAAPPALYAIAIAVSAVSAFFTPYLIRSSPRVIDALAKRAPSGILAFASTYGAWVRRVGKTDKQDPLRKGLRTDVLTSILIITVIVSIFGLGNLFAGTIRDNIRAAAGEQVAALGFEWLFISLAATPFAFMLYREMRQIVNGLAKAAVPQRLRAAEPTQTERLLRRTFGFVVTVVFAFATLVVGGIFIENFFYVAVVAGSGILVGSMLLGASLRKFHAEVEATIARMTTDDATGDGPSREEAIHLLEASNAWGAGSLEVKLPRVSGAGKRTIGQLRLRELTGASVVSVQRAGVAPIVNPGAELRFEPGDSVLLLGEEAALKRGQEILLGVELGISGGASEIPVSVSIPVRDVNLESDVLLLVIRRAGEAHEPSDDFVLQKGDVLVVSGPDDAVERARSRLA